jgi:hypothetical protein
MIRRLAALALLALLALALIAGCSGRGVRKDAARVLRTAEDSLSYWRGRADSIEVALGSLELVRGQFVQGVGTSHYAAWFDSAGARVIHEEMNLGRMGSRSNRYYYEQGVPRLALESGMQPVDSTLTLRRLERAVLFDDFGRLVAASKTLDSLKMWVAGYEADATLMHAQQLRTTAQDARSSKGTMAPPEGGTPAGR